MVVVDIATIECSAVSKFKKQRNMFLSKLFEKFAFLFGKSINLTHKDKYCDMANIVKS